LKKSPLDKKFKFNNFYSIYYFFINLFCKESDKLIIIFGGLTFGNNIFEFLKTLSNFNVNKIYIKDATNNWYLTGVKGVGSTPQEISEFLAEIISQNKHIKKVYTLGISAGGFAAILFGYLLQCNSILSICPQTILSQNMLDSVEHPESLHKNIFRTLNIIQDKYQSFELMNIIKNNYETKCNLLYPYYNETDRAHANNLINIPGLTIIPLASEEHSLGKEIKNKNLLNLLISNFLEENDIINFFEEKAPDFLIKT
jgi:hypothetical protein